MPKKIDITPIPVERTRRTLRYELIMDNAGELVEVVAHRYLFTIKTANGGSQASTPEYNGVIHIPASSVPVAVKNKVSDIESLVDAQDL
jgi:hypothetical protein